MPTNSKQQLTGMKKRQQIVSAQKKIFMWVIIASVALSLCGVAIQFLFKQAAFNQKVISAKAETQRTLTNNLDNAQALKNNVNQLIADTRLQSVKANPEDTTFKVVLDALPTTDDKSALGASLQQVILPRSGVIASDITTITEATGGDPAEAAAADTTMPQETSFTFTATGDYDRVKNMLGDLERSIRPMDLQVLSFQNNQGSLRTTVTGVSYFLPERTVQLGKKTIQP